MFETFPILPENTTTFYQDFISALPYGVKSNIMGLITILKAVGIAVIVYLLYLVVRGIFRWRDSQRLKYLASNVSEINKKLDLLVEKNTKKKK